MSRETRDNWTLWGLFLVVVALGIFALLASNGTLDWMLA